MNCGTLNRGGRAVRLRDSRNTVPVCAKVIQAVAHSLLDRDVCSVGRRARTAGRPDGPRPPLGALHQRRVRAPGRSSTGRRRPVPAGSGFRVCGQRRVRPVRVPDRCCGLAAGGDSPRALGGWWTRARLS
jgi:hypothetical protein